jgi:hypothetical protein
MKKKVYKIPFSKVGYELNTSPAKFARCHESIIRSTLGRLHVGNSYLYAFLTAVPYKARRNLQALPKAYRRAMIKLTFRVWWGMRNEYSEVMLRRREPKPSFL